MKSERTPKAKDPYHKINLMENINIDGFLNTPPKIRFGVDEMISQVFLTCIGRGRLEKFAILAKPLLDGELEITRKTYNVLGESNDIVGEREGVGFVTSVAFSQKMGTTVAIGVVKSIYIDSVMNGSVLYQNLHWNHWRVARVTPINNDQILH